MTLKDSVMETPWHISTFDSPIDGISIRFAYLRPNKKAQRAILFLNGRSEWIEKYAMLPELFKLGDDVLWISLDHRGQGGSGGIRAHVDTYADFAVDAATALKTIAGDLPYAIISHSMGGLIALYGSLLGLLKPQALALSSPLLALPNTPIPRYLAKPLAQMIASTRLRFQPTGAGASNRLVFDKNNLTSSAQGFKLIAESPYPFVSPSFGWVEASFIACNEIFKSEQLSLLKTPVRILGGSEE
ncbi:MAG: alpha/beta hydrolase, partial [Proteobacteria bacterium]|nr:alpha/beta hydrolase [Pseudomonadota bacterium]